MNGNVVVSKNQNAIILMIHFLLFLTGNRSLMEQVINGMVISYCDRNKNKVNLFPDDLIEMMLQFAVNQDIHLITKKKESYYYRRRVDKDGNSNHWKISLSDIFN